MKLCMSVTPGKMWNGATAAGIKSILIARPEDPERPKLLDYTRNHEIAERAAFNYSVLTIKSLSELMDLVKGPGRTNVR